MDKETKNGSSDAFSFEEDGSYRIPHPESYYSDASFSPASESFEPTRLYTPSKKAEKPSSDEKKEDKKEKRRAGAKKRGPAFIVVLCLICVCLGCLAGMFVMNERYASNIAGLEERLNDIEAERTASEISPAEVSPAAVVNSAGPANDMISPAQIYSDACSSVVGITSEITYTNFFGMKSSNAVSGTGFFISKEGYIITNYHVIEAACTSGSSISAIFHDGASRKAELVGADSDGDIAVLKVESGDYVPVSLGNSTSINVGDEVFAVGNPLGELSFTMTSGRISALDRSITTDSNSVPINMFQIDAPVNSGNSGGPLYNAEGEVVGVVTAKYSSGSIEGIGFAIPINHVCEVSTDLITKGYVTGKPFLGVMIDQRYTGTYSFYYHLPMGAYVYSVEKGSCAERSGIKPGDIITSAGNTSVESFSDLQLAVSRYGAGDDMDITVYRNGTEYVVKVTLDENHGNSKYM